MRKRKSPPVPTSLEKTADTATGATVPPVHDAVLATRWDVDDVRAWLAPLHESA